MAENADGGHRHRTAGRRAGLRLPRAARSSAALEAVRTPAARRGAAPRRRPPFPSRHRGGDRLVSAAARLDGGCGAVALPDLGSRLDDQRRRGSTVERGDAPLVVSFPHTGTDLAGIEARLVSPWLARRTPTGGSTGSMTSPPSSARPSCARASRAPSSTSTAIRPAPRSIPARRRPTCARPTTFDGEPLYRAGERPDAAEIDRAPARAISTPIMRRSRPRSHGCAQLHPTRRPLRLPLDPLGHPAAVRRRAAGLQYRHQ